MSQFLFEHFLISLVYILYRLNNLIFDVVVFSISLKVEDKSTKNYFSIFVCTMY